MGVPIYFHLIRKYASSHGSCSSFHVSNKMLPYIYFHPRLWNHHLSPAFVDLPAWHPDPQLDLIPFGILLPLTNGAEM